MASPIATQDRATVFLPPIPATISVTFNGRVVGTTQVTLLAKAGPLSVTASDVASWQETALSRKGSTVFAADAASVTESVVVGSPPKVVFVREAAVTDVVHTSESAKAVEA